MNSLFMSLVLTVEGTGSNCVSYNLVIFEEIGIIAYYLYTCKVTRLALISKMSCGDQERAKNTNKPTSIGFLKRSVQTRRTEGVEERVGMAPLAIFQHMHMRGQTCLR